MIPVYCISLPSLNRREKIAAELARVGFTDVTYVSAAEPCKDFTMSNQRRNARGEFGCALSHIKAIMTAISDDALTPLFIEDDVTFSEEVYSNVGRQDFEFPEDWNLIYWGGHPREPVEMIAPKIAKVGKFACAEAYMMHRYSMPRFVQFWCDRAGQKNGMFDFVLGEFAAQGGGYAIYPTLTHQPPGWSHIGQKNDDKTDLIRRGWENNLSTRSA